MKGPPLLSLSCSDGGLPCSAVALNDGPDPLEWRRLERTPHARERSSPRASMRNGARDASSEPERYPPDEGLRNGVTRVAGAADEAANEVAVDEVAANEAVSNGAASKESASGDRAQNAPDGRLPDGRVPDTGEAASAEQAYQLWKERVWRFASRLGVPSEQLEDATQDVFTAVFRRWHDFRGQSTRRTWVLGFVPRVASSYRRRRRRPAEPTRESGGDGALAAVPSADHDPFETAARQEAKRIVTHFLDGLPELDRQLFVLVELEDASVVEAAAILELGPSRAYKILDRARRALEAALVRQRAADGRRLP